MNVRRLPGAVDLLRVIDAAYATTLPASQWFSGVLTAMASAFDWGLGIGGIRYAIVNDKELIVEQLEGIDISSDWKQAGLAFHSDPRTTPGAIEIYRSNLCAVSAYHPRALTPEVMGEIAATYDSHHVGGHVMINGVDCSGKGCALYLFSPRSCTLTAVQGELFHRLATHFATAYRLQQQVAAGTRATQSEPEAVLLPNGHVDHAEGAAHSLSSRQDLQRAVLERERARKGAKHAEGRHLVQGLKGLVNARWTLVDHWETGGKRYVVARENEPKPLGPTPLSKREQQILALAALGRSNKLIAYELGLAHSTVRVLLTRAAAKLGVRSRSELIARYRSRNL